MLDEPRMRMFKPRNPELGEWKVNRQPEPHAWVKPTLDMLLEKYTRQCHQSVFQRLGDMVQRRSPSLGVDHSRRHFVDEAATRGGCYHPSIGEPSRYQG
jgi:hypothetical protein